MNKVVAPEPVFLDDSDTVGELSLRSHAAGEGGELINSVGAEACIKLQGENRDFGGSV